MQEQPNQEQPNQEQPDQEQLNQEQSDQKQAGGKDGSWSTDEIGRQGDRSAPVGSEEWAIYIAHRIHSGIKDTESDARQVEGWIRDFRSAGGHGTLGYESWEDFCAEWIGLEAREVEVIISRRRAARQKACGTWTDESGNAITPGGRTLGRHGGKRKDGKKADGRRASGEKRGRRQGQVDDDQLGGDRPGSDRLDDNRPDSDGPRPASEEGGTSADYLVARIARDHPSVHEKMKAGRYRSVRQAAIDAGIIKDRMRVSFYADDPERACKNIFKHMAWADVQRLRALIGERLEKEDPEHLP